MRVAAKNANDEATIKKANVCSGLFVVLCTMTNYVHTVLSTFQMHAYRWITLEHRLGQLSPNSMLLIMETPMAVGLTCPLILAKTPGT